MTQSVHAGFLRDDASGALVVTGVGDIAYAENTVQQSSLAAGFVAVPGLSILVPANSGNVDLEYYEPGLQISFAAAATTATTSNVRCVIEDEAGALVVVATWTDRAIVASDSKIRPMTARRRVANNAGDKTYTAKLYLASITNITGINAFRGAGTTNEAGVGADLGPAFIRARAV